MQPHVFRANIDLQHNVITIGRFKLGQILLCQHNIITVGGSKTQSRAY